jgi:tRNA/tmRNA/rRNA uracil-C5-methylase (TrmA/RlmC/RlmD family)
MEEQRLRELLGEGAAAEPGLRHVLCQVDSYEQLLEAKVARARAVMEAVTALGQQQAAGAAATPAEAPQAQVELEVNRSQRSHFRQRVDLWVRSDVNEGLPGAVLYYAMAPRKSSAVEPEPGPEPEPEAGGGGELQPEPASGSPAPNITGVRLNGFPAASLRVNALMDGLMAALNSAPAGSTLRSQLYEARFLTTLRGAGPPLVTLIYHRKLGPDWLDAAQMLAAALGCSLVGRSRGQKLIVGSDWVDEELHLRTDADPDAECESFCYRHAENGFSQPNAGVNEHMLGFALSCTSNAVFGTSDLLEL